RLDEWLFEVTWRRSPSARAESAEGPWLVLADAGGVGEALARELGEDVTVVTRGSAYERLGPKRVSMDAGDREQVRRLLREVPVPRGVVHLLSLDSPAIEDEATLARAQELTCASTLHVAQAVGEMGWGSAPRLYVVTRGTQAAESSGEVKRPEQALAWG